MLPVKWVVLWTDGFFYSVFFSFLMMCFTLSRKADSRRIWQGIFQRRLAIVAAVVLSVYFIIGLLDSLHFQRQLPTYQGETHYSPRLESVLDRLLMNIGKQPEKTYSAPFATTSFMPELLQTNAGTHVYDYPALQFAGQHMDPQTHVVPDILLKLLVAGCLALGAWAIAVLVTLIGRRYRHRWTWWQACRYTLQDTETSKQLTWQISLLVSLWVLFSLVYLGQFYHVLGTTKVGVDVLYMSLKSIRTGLVIGTLTTLLMLPFACIMGIASGYFGGRIDDFIQYLYTTLSSVPSVLLIAASILSLQVYISNHASAFHTLAERADLRLLVLCMILGLTSWTSLCRLLRAETLKLREADYIKAARTLGSGHSVVIFKHILSNVMHIVLITVVLDFSGLVLAEAVLSYVGVGVDPSSMSWGNTINSARLELARDPVVWWPLLASFVFMFILVLAANLFADAVREGYDPKGQTRGN